MGLAPASLPRSTDERRHWLQRTPVHVLPRLGMRRAPVRSVLAEAEILEDGVAALDERAHIGVELAGLVPHGGDAARLHGGLHLGAGHGPLRRLEELLAAVLRN